MKNFINNYERYIGIVLKGLETRPGRICSISHDTPGA